MSDYQMGKEMEALQCQVRVLDEKIAARNGLEDQMADLKARMDVREQLDVLLEGLKLIFWDENENVYKATEKLKAAIRAKK